MIAKKKIAKKSGSYYKKLNIGFKKEIHEKLSLIAEKEHRSLTAQIEFIIEKEVENYKL